MVLVMLILLVLAIAAGAAMSASRRDPSVAPQAEEPANLPSASELAERDPIDALLLYGTAEDAARLADQGVDLGRLGHRPSGEE